MTAYTQSGHRLRELLCPLCEHPGSAKDDQWSCKSCATHFTLRILCHKCQTPVERFNGCGSEGYVCGSCRAMCSRRAVIYELTAR